MMYTFPELVRVAKNPEITKSTDIISVLFINHEMYFAKDELGSMPSSFLLHIYNLYKSILLILFHKFTNTF